MGDPEDYSIAREGVWGREGLAIAVPQRLAFILEPLGAVFARGNEVKSHWVVLGWSWVGLGRPRETSAEGLGGFGEGSCQIFPGPRAGG